MRTDTRQRLVAWVPAPEVASKAPLFGDVSIVSPEHQKLSVTLPYEEGELHLHFKDVRAFMTCWDGDPNPFLTIAEATARPSNLFKVEGSRWLSSQHFSLDIESSTRVSDAPWEHFCILSGERSLHVAARSDLQANWVAGTWSGGPGAWNFTAAE